MPLPKDIPDHQKLTVLMRIESGSLGPQGASHLITFCEFAKKKVKTEQSGHFWKFLPREDKHEPEVSFEINGKPITSSQAEKYLKAFELELDAFSWELADKAALLIEHYFDRNAD